MIEYGDLHSPGQSSTLVWKLAECFLPLDNNSLLVIMIPFSLDACSQRPCCAQLLGEKELWESALWVQSRPALWALRLKQTSLLSVHWKKHAFPFPIPVFTLVLSLKMPSLYHLQPSQMPLICHQQLESHLWVRLPEATLYVHLESTFFMETA